MARTHDKPEEIVSKLRQVEVLNGQGVPIAQAAGEVGTTEQTYYRWRKEYGSLSVDQAKRLKEVEKENTRLRKLVADLSLDKAILKEVAEGKY